MQGEDAQSRQHPRIAAVLCNCFHRIASNYFHRVTLVLSAVAWLLAFAAQIVVTKIVGRAAVGVLWFAVFLQLFLNLAVFFVLASEDLTSFRLQLAFFATMASVFAVIGVDMSLFTGEPSREAMAAGWLVLAVVDILWVLYFSAEPGTLLARLVESMEATRSETGGRKADPRSVEAGDTSFYDAEMRSDGSPDETKVGHEKSGADSDARNGASPDRSPEWRGMEQHIVDRSQEALEEPEADDQEEVSRSANERSQNLNRSRAPPPSSKNRRAVYVDEHRHLSTIYDKTESTSESASASASASRDSQRDSAQLFPYKVRARSDWIPRSPSEISFRKGDILHSAEKEGKKWWKVRKTDGSVGTAPSNYFKVVNS
ncbi:hypothetical protein FB451DRAFT_1389512 [Mycena latifolia]|nr:hypothetical protein FB451DRAFT_1389512 [Mycena latifolia]